MSTPRLCVVGSTNIDLTLRTPRLPRPGETLAGRGFHLGCGGKGANQAVMAARLGAHVALVGKVGKDLFGDQALRNFQEQGVDTTFVLRDDANATGVAGILVDDEARNCIIVAGGANLALTPADVRRAEAAIRASQIVICQLEVPLETTLEALRIGRGAGVRTILNPAPAVPLPDEMLRLADLCVPNESELELLTGRGGASLVDVEAAARLLLRRGPGCVLVTLGARGVLCVDGGDAVHVPAVAVQAVDPTGAGDAFIGSLAVCLAEQVSLPEAIRRANVVAALSVTRPGAQDSFPRRAEVEELRRPARPGESPS